MTRTMTRSRATTHGIPSTLANAALDCARRGWHVFPLAPGAKAPVVRDWEKRATTDPERIAACWAHGPYNVGLACGPSGLVVVDLDRPKPDQQPPTQWRQPGVHDGGDVLAVLCEQAAADWPGDTFTVGTGSGGTHLYYRHPDSGPQLRNTAGTLGWLIDTRSHGGYVVAAGSVVNGNPYTVSHNADPMPLPGWLAQQLTPRPLPPQQPVTVALTSTGKGRRDAYVRAAVERTVAAITGSGDGRKQRLFGGSVSLGQFVAGGELDQDATEALLLRAALDAGLAPRASLATIRSGFRHGANRPRTIHTDQQPGLFETRAAA